MYRKTPTKIQRKFEACIITFHKNPFDRTLENHLLHGKWNGFRSIDITGDWRAIYLEVGESSAEFYAIGTHDQLYK